jgi:hypothetical protein
MSDLSIFNTSQRSAGISSLPRALPDAVAAGLVAAAVVPDERSEAAAQAAVVARDARSGAPVAVAGVRPPEAVEARPPAVAAAPALSPAASDAVVVAQPGAAARRVGSAVVREALARPARPSSVPQRASDSAVAVAERRLACARCPGSQALFRGPEPHRRLSADRLGRRAHS